MAANVRPPVAIGVSLDVEDRRVGAFIIPTLAGEKCDIGRTRLIPSKRYSFHQWKKDRATHQTNRKQGICIMHRDSAKKVFWSQSEEDKLESRGIYFGPKNNFYPPPAFEIDIFPSLATRCFSTPIMAFLP
jgi:hypothetical protein